MNTLFTHAQLSATEALAEVELILTVTTTKGSPVPAGLRDYKVAHALAQSEWLGQVLGRDVSTTEALAYERHLEQWAQRILVKPKKRKRKRY